MGSSLLRLTLSAYGSQSQSLVAVCRLLIVVASLVVAHRL